MAYLREIGSQDVAIFSAPNHARRAIGTARRASNADLNFVAPDVIDTPKLKHKWAWWPSLETHKILYYELAAYLYYKVRGWL